MVCVARIFGRFGGLHPSIHSSCRELTFVSIHVEREGEKGGFQCRHERNSEFSQSQRAVTFFDEKKSDNDEDLKGKESID